MKKILFVLITFSFVPSLFSQTKESDLNRQMLEIMKARQEMIQSLFNDSDFGYFDDQMDDHFSDLIKRFQQNRFGGMPDLEMGDVVGEYDWRESDKDVTLVLKVTQIKDKPLDIKIEKGQIKLKGDIESVSENPSQDKLKKKGGKYRSFKKVHFERIFSIPQGVDQDNPVFENKEGELSIKFKKTHGSKTLPSSSVKKNTPSEEERRPVEKEAGDVSI